MRPETIGFLETGSIARGIEAADAAIKAAQVTLHFARPNCPGKYNILISGEVAAVQAAIEAGAQAAGHTLIEQLVIPRVHPQVISAMNMAASTPQRNAVGILEFFSVTSAVLGADAAVKASDVELIDIRLGTGLGGKSFVLLCGDTSAVTQAVDSGACAATESGMLFAKSVIANPMKELFESLL